MKSISLLIAVFAAMIFYPPVFAQNEDRNARKDKDSVRTDTSIRYELPSIEDSFGMFKDLGWPDWMVMEQVDNVYFNIMDKLDLQIMMLEKELLVIRSQMGEANKKKDDKAAAEFKQSVEDVKVKIKSLKKLKPKITRSYIQTIEKIENDYDKDLK